MVEMTRDEFLKRSAVERALQAQLQQGQTLDLAALQGVLLMAVQISHRLKVTPEELQKLVTTEVNAYATFLDMKQRIAQAKKGK